MPKVAVGPLPIAVSALLQLSLAEVSLVEAGGERWPVSECQGDFVAVASEGPTCLAGDGGGCCVEGLNSHFLLGDTWRVVGIACSLLGHHGEGSRFQSYVGHPTGLAVAAAWGAQALIRRMRMLPNINTLCFILISFLM